MSERSSAVSLFLRSVAAKVVSFLFRRALATWPAAKGNWKKGMKQEIWAIYPIAAALLFYLVIPSAFELGWKTGASFMIAGASAIYFGYIFRNFLAIVLVYVGVVFGGEITKLFGNVVSTGIAGDWPSAIIMFGVAGYLWLWAERMKRSDFDWEPMWLQRFVKRPTPKLRRTTPSKRSTRPSARKRRRVD